MRMLFDAPSWEIVQSGDQKAYGALYPTHTLVTDGPERLSLSPQYDPHAQHLLGGSLFPSMGRGGHQEHAWMTTTSSRLLHEVLAGRAEPLDVMVLSTWPTLTREQSQAVATWQQGQPILTHLITTPLGRVGLLLLPLTASPQILPGEGEQRPSPALVDLALGGEVEQQEIFWQASAGVSLAQACGAGVVTLSDALAAWTDQGRGLLDAVVRRAGKRPRLTTTAATTSATLILHLQQLLPLLRRHLSREHVAVLAGDEMALATVCLLLTTCSHPQTLLWCDVLGRQEQQEQQAQPCNHVSPECVRNVLGAHGFQGTVLCDTVREGYLPAAISDATLILEATIQRMPSATMDVSRLAPGTILLLRSPEAWPSPEQVEHRLASREDVLLVDGNELSCCSSLRDLWGVPNPGWEGAPVLERLMQTNSVRGMRPERPTDLRAELWAGLLVHALGAPALCGPLNADVAFAHYVALQKAQLTVPPLRYENHSWSSAFLLQFRTRFRMPPAHPMHGRKDV